MEKLKELNFIANKYDCILNKSKDRERVYTLVSFPDVLPIQVTDYIDCNFVIIDNDKFSIKFII